LDININMNIFKKADDFYKGLIETKIIFLLISFAFLISYYLLYIFRYLDNTVLMNWNQVFNYVNININELLIILSIVLFISYIISRVNIFDKYNQENNHILFLFVSGMIVGSLFWNIPEINPDAARYISQARYLEEYGILAFINDWGNEFFIWMDFPSIPFFYGIIFRYFGEYREYIQIFNTILFSLTAVLTYKISKTLWNREIGLYSGFLLMSFPFLLSQIPLTLVDIPQMFLTTSTIFIIIKIFDNKYFVIPASILLFFTIYTKLTSILVILPIFSILIINNKSIINDWYRWGCTIFFSGILVMSFLFWKIDIFINQILLMTNRSFTVPESQLVYFFQIGAIVILFALFSLIIAYNRKDRNYLILILWVIIPFLILSNTRIRYMVPVFPGIAIMASISLNAISAKSVKKFLIISLILTSIIFSIITYIPYEENFSDRNVKDAAEFTNELENPDVQLFLDFSENQIYNPEPFVSLFDFYSNKRIIYSNSNKYYASEDYLNSWTSKYTLPPFYYDDVLQNKPIIVIISDKKESSLMKNDILKDYILIEKFETNTISILNPASVKVYMLQDY